MNFFNIGPGELLFILVIALIIFGPGKLPEVAKGLGKAVGDFRRASQGLTDDLTRELNAATTESKQALEPSPTEMPSREETHAPADDTQGAQSPAPAVETAAPSSAAEAKDSSA